MELAGSHLVFQLAEVMVLRLLFAALLRRSIAFHRSYAAAHSADRADAKRADHGQSRRDGAFPSASCANRKLACCIDTAELCKHTRSG